MFYILKIQSCLLCFFADLPHSVWWIHTAQCWARETMMSMSSWQLCRVGGSLLFGGTNAGECDNDSVSLYKSCDDHKIWVQFSLYLSYAVGQYRICAWTKFRASFWMSHQGCHWELCLSRWDADTGWRYGTSTDSFII